MGFFKSEKKAAAGSIGSDAKRSLDEGHSVFVAQLRGGTLHSPDRTEPISGIAEMIEAVEAVGWHMDRFTSMPYKDNITVIALFRRQP
jgi:hypothetical protein